MRVITGKARGMKLRSLEGTEIIRPTADAVKESMFSIVQFDIDEDTVVLDLFAGSGQLGIEALSRGAESCTFVDTSKKALDIVGKNLETCALKGKLVNEDARLFLKRGGKYDIVFLDPPYASGLYDEILDSIASADILSQGGCIVAESPRELSLPELGEPYKKLKEYRYGRIKLTLYSRN